MLCNYILSKVFYANNKEISKIMIKRILSILTLDLCLSQQYYAYKYVKS